MNLNRLLFPLTLLMVGLAMQACAGVHRHSPTSVDFGPVPESAAEVKPLGVGDRAPLLPVRDGEDREVDLGALYREGPVVLIFYRGGWCPYCTEHLAAMADIDEALEELGVTVLAVSPDSPATIRAGKGEHAFAYRIVSDQDMWLSQGFGVAFRVDDPTMTMLQDYGIDIQAASERRHRMLPVPAVYVIDRSGEVRFAHWEADYRKRLEPNAVLEAVRIVVGSDDG
ncbi:MAG: AhpC/TSA family protein [Phycisphaeraceae bacterium]|nr:AhpC/TSA family protein [Phycisphaeraceae bacterium]